VGLFDERFPPATGLDDDLNFRMKIAGYRLYIEEGAYVEHRRSTTVRAIDFGLDIAREKATRLLAEKYTHAYFASLYGDLALEDKDRQRLEKIARAMDPLLEDYSRVEDYLPFAQTC
jgi:GT2 family glycosyltransferase